MAKITAVKKKGKPSSVSISGSVGEACLLALDVMMKLGAQIRATYAANGVTKLEPDGEPPNDFALAIVTINNVLLQQVREEERKKAAALQETLAKGLSRDQLLAGVDKQDEPSYVGQEGGDDGEKE